jgi:hypothetical protein
MGSSVKYNYDHLPVGTRIKVHAAQPKEGSDYDGWPPRSYLNASSGATMRFDDYLFGIACLAVLFLSTALILRYYLH